MDNKDYEVCNAVDTLLRAEEIRADKALMSKVAVELEKKKKAISSIQDIKDLKNAKALPDDSEEEDTEEADSPEEDAAEEPSKAVKVEIHLNHSPQMTEDQMVEAQDAQGVEKGLKPFKMAKNRAKGA